MAGADAAAAAQEAADLGDTNGRAATPQPAASRHASEADAVDGAAPRTADLGPAKAGDAGEDRRSHRKYRKREGSQSASPQRDDKRSKKKRHHDRSDRDGDKKHHKHKHHKRRNDRERHSDDEAQPAIGNGLNPDTTTPSKPAETGLAVVEQQEQEQFQLRELALRKLDPQVDGTDEGAEMSGNMVRRGSEAVPDRASEHDTVAV